MAALDRRLVLHTFMCRQFSHPDMESMLKALQGVPPTIRVTGESEYARALYVNPTRAQVTHDQLAEYDANIAAHSDRLRMTEDHGRTWKPHQYLALLFTEHYLRRYFDEPEALRADLNVARKMEREMLAMPEYTPHDLRVLAFQSATGSGKTLLMHAHILQYRHYLNRAGGRLNNVVLLTPNEQMSAQHERELHESGLHARLFSSEASADLFQPVEIIDLNKLAEKKGVKRVAVRDFGDDNLVLVDEGHLGASGKVWRERRRELSSGGFTFEYSATFNQVVGGKDPDLLHAYGKCLLFDYAYHRFHADGYGKDYAISNLPHGAEDENSDMYLLGCLLTFYQQCRIWRSRAAEWKAFNPAKPLWVFLGKTVSGASKADRAIRSDVARILSFLGWVLAHAAAVRPMLARLLEGRSSLLDDTGADYFAGRFGHLPRTGTDLYADLCDLLFHGQGRLHVAYLTAGEGRAAPARRGQPALRRGQRGRLCGALQAADRSRQSGFRRRPGAGLRRAAVRRRGPAGLNGERRHRGAPRQHGPQEALGLAQRQPEDQPQHQRGHDGHVRELPRSTRSTRRRRSPRIHRLGGEPQGHVAPPDERLLIFRPIPTVIFGLVLRMNLRLHPEIVGQERRPGQLIGDHDPRRVRAILHQRPVGGSRHRPVRE